MSHSSDGRGAVKRETTGDFVLRHIGYAIVIGAGAVTWIVLVIALTPQ